MSKEENDTLALKLLNSQDSKVAEAAKRIFSNTTLSTDVPKLAVKNSPTTSTMVQKTSGSVSQEIQEAASAVVMLAPQHQNLIQIRKSGTSFGITPTSVPVQPLEPVKTPIPNRWAATPSERVKRSRERNKMHARKTRQRKKEHMLGLEKRVNDLKSKQISMKQLINEKATANILLCLAPRSSNVTTSTVDPKVEALIQRPNSEIPDATKIPDLPVLILPGANSKKRKALQMVGGEDADSHYPDDGIDYELLGKDRSTCSPEELDKIRRERNRMHAKRTRDRKRIFMERMEEIMKTLQSENLVLEKHLTEITKDSSSNSTSLRGTETPSLTSPSLPPSLDNDGPESSSGHTNKISVQDPSIMGTAVVPESKGDKEVVFNISSHTSLNSDIKVSTSVNAASSTTNATAVAVSDDGTSSQSSSHAVPKKDQCLEEVSAVPTSITTKSPKAVHC